MRAEIHFQLFLRVLLIATISRKYFDGVSDGNRDIRQKKLFSDEISDLKIFDIHGFRRDVADPEIFTIDELSIISFSIGMKACNVKLGAISRV